MNYPPGMTLRPLIGWPREFTAKRTRSPFRSDFTDTIDLLKRELFALGPGSKHAPSVLQIALTEQDFRRTDGMPRAAALPSHPGVILTIDTATAGTLSYPCDRFQRWQDNLRAIALGLEALRKIHRYGISPGHEQYRGWQAIEAPKQKQTLAELVAFLAKVAGEGGVPEGSVQNVVRLLRAARAQAHPDRNNGDATLFNAVQQAGEQLRRMGWL